VNQSRERRARWPRPLLAANWKMNHGPREGRAFVRDYAERMQPRGDRTVILFPAALSLAAVCEAAATRPDLHLGVQNIYWKERGAFTGEISAPMAREAGAEFVLVGHSERRHLFGETDADTGHKCAAAVSVGLTPILCVGELLAEREAGRAEEVVLRQLRAGLEPLTSDQIATVVIAYEPVWAIGTGRTAAPSDATRIDLVLRGALRELLPADAPDPPILYGGSCTAANAPDLLGAPAVDGLLVGGASLDPVSWAAIVSTAVGQRA
jgi:triosephosphate isomerase